MSLQLSRLQQALVVTVAQGTARAKDVQQETFLLKYSFHSSLIFFLQGFKLK